MTNTKQFLEEAYKNPDAVPWETKTPPEELINLIKDGAIKSGKALDIGCGTGNFAIYLAQNGFDVTGIDISGNAIRAAQKKAEAAQCNITFLELDSRDVGSLKDTFDFVLEWGILHFIMPEFREPYIKNVASKINKGGKYMVLTFNEQSPEWGGGKYRKGITGSDVYYSSMEELENLYKPHFKIIEQKIRPTFFKNSGNEHLENYLLLERDYG